MAAGGYTWVGRGSYLLWECSLAGWKAEFAKEEKGPRGGIPGGPLPSAS